MSTVLVIYILSLLEKLNILSIIILVITVLVSFFVSMYYCGECIHMTRDKNDLEKWYRFYLRRAGIVVGLCCFLQVVIPSTDKMYLMAGAHYLQKSELPDRVGRILNQKLDEIETRLLKKEQPHGIEFKNGQ